MCPSFASFSSHTGTKLSYAIVLQLYLNLFFSLTSLSKVLLFCLSAVHRYLTLPYFLFRRSYVQMLSTYINTLLQMEVEDTEEGMIWCDSGNIEAVWA